MSEQADEYVDRVKFLSQEELDRGIAEVAEIAQVEGRQVVLIGGGALQFYGSDRMTRDVDFVFDEQPEALPSLAKLSFGGIKSASPTGVPVDIIVPTPDVDGQYVGPEAVYLEAMTYGRKVKGVPVQVASAEYVVVLKMLAKRPKDLADLDFLLTSPAVDLEKAKRMVDRLLGWYAVDDFNSYLRTARWNRSCGR